MNNTVKKYRDEHYEWWSTDDVGRVLKVHASEREITIADWWQQYFLWEPASKKQHHYKSKDLSKAMYSPTAYCYNVFYKTGESPKNRWGGNIWGLSDRNQLEYPLSAYITILYRRNIASIHLDELAALQLECEELIEKAGKAHNGIDRCCEKLEGILPFGKKAAREDLEKNRHEIKELIPMIDRCMERVEEVRQLILREQK